MDWFSWPLWLQIVSGLAGAIVGVWGLIEALEGLSESYRKYGPPVARRLRVFGRKRPMVSALVAFVIAGTVGVIGWRAFLGFSQDASPNTTTANNELAAFAYVRPQPPEADGRVRLAIWNKGDKPLAGVRVRMFETLLDPSLPPPSDLIPKELQIGSLAAGHVESTRLSIYPYDGKRMRMYRFEIISEALSVEQTLLFRYNEKIRSLDDMTTVTHLPAKIVNGKLQFLINQDWHEWTPPPGASSEVPPPDGLRVRNLEFSKPILNDHLWVTVAYHNTSRQNILARGHATIYTVGLDQNEKLPITSETEQRFEEHGGNRCF